MMSFVQKNLGLDSDFFDDEAERQVADKQIKEMFGEEHTKRARLYKIMGMNYKEYQASKWIHKPQVTPREPEAAAEDKNQRLKKYCPCCHKKLHAWLQSFAGKSLHDLMVIDHEGAGYVKFNFLVTMCCLFSSQMYVTFAAFREMPNEPLAQWLTFMFEVIFAGHMATQFVLTYEIEG